MNNEFQWKNDQAQAWQQVCKTLDEVLPNWGSLATSGSEAACAAIRQLGGNREPILTAADADADAQHLPRPDNPTPEATALQLQDMRQGLRLLQYTCHRNSYRAGWWDVAGIDMRALMRDPRGAKERHIAGALVAQKLALIHSEVSEALEGHRKGLMDDKLPHRPMVEVELADAIIRIADLAGALQLDLAGAIVEKLAYNTTREDHKPEARAAAGGKAY